MARTDCPEARAIWAVVPIKRFDQAKKRLASALTTPQRRGLMLAMAQDVLTALSQARRLSGILLVSRDPETDALARAFGVCRFAESETANLPQALTEARDHAANLLGASGVFIVPADAPLISGAEVDQLIQAHRHVTLLPDGEAIGTNGLICTPPDAIPFVFDGKSFKAHAAHAQATGFPPRVVANSGFALDIDTPDDLAQLLRQAPSGKTAEYLRECGLADNDLGPDRGDD